MHTWEKSGLYMYIVISCFRRFPEKIGWPCVELFINCCSLSDIAERLKPHEILASSDLASDVQSPEYDVLLRAWMNMMSAADISPEAMERMRRAYANDVGVLPPAKIASIIKSGGFELPVQFFQAGLIHAWLSKRARKTRT